MKATLQHIRVVLFIMLYIGGSKTLVSDHSTGRCLAVFSYDSVTPAVQGAVSFRLGMKMKPPILYNPNESCIDL